MNNLENGPCHVAPDGQTTLYNPYRSDLPLILKSIGHLTFRTVGTVLVMVSTGRI